MPDAHSYSPYQGMAATVDRLWTEQTYASKESMFASQIDFDADVMQPHLSEYDEDEELTYSKDAAYSPAIDGPDFNKYNRRLEDIPSEYLENYVCNLVYTICKLSGGVKAYNYAHPLAPTLIDIEDGSAIDLADLELDYNKSNWSDADTKRALSQMPYTLKRLLNLSCYTGVHVLSFICSYMIAKEKNKLAQQCGSTKILKRNDVISENVWTSDTLGNAVKKVEVSNKNLKVYELFDWIEGSSTKYVPYKEDATNFMHYAKVLNLDIREDMSKYGFDFMSKLTVLSLTPNTQYNSSVYNALLKGTSVQSGSADLIGKTMTRFLEICTSTPVVQKVVNEFDYTHRTHNFDLAKKLHYANRLMQGKMGERAVYEFYDGFLYCNGELAVLQCGMITDYMFSDGRVLLSELGYCVAVSDSLILDLMTMGIAYDNMQIKLSGNKEEHLEGWWSVPL